MTVKILDASEKKLLEQTIKVFGELVSLGDHEEVGAMLVLIKKEVERSQSDPNVSKFLDKLIKADPSERDELLINAMRVFRQMIDQGYVDSEVQS